MKLSLRLGCSLRAIYPSIHAQFEADRQPNFVSTEMFYEKTPNTHVLFVGLVIATRSTFSTDTFTICCAMACTTGYSKMKRIAMPKHEPTTFAMINHRLLYSGGFGAGAVRGTSSGRTSSAAAPIVVAAPAPTTPADIDEGGNAGAGSAKGLTGIPAGVVCATLAPVAGA